MKFKRSISPILMTLCVAALFGIGRAEFHSHIKAASASRQPGPDREQALNLAGTIGPTVTTAIIGRNLHLTVPLNTAVKKGDVIGEEESSDASGEIGRARQELEYATSAERQAAEDVRQIEEELATVQLTISSMDREEVQARAAAFDAEREFDRRDTLLRSGLSSRFDYNAAVTARASAEATVDSVRSSISEASIETDELAAKALEAKTELREATSRRGAAEIVLEQMQGSFETKPVISPADGFIVVSEQPEGTSVGIASDGQLLAYARVREADLMRVRVGQEASIALDAEPGATFHAQVSAIAETSEVSPEGSFYQVTFVVEDPGGSWLSGVAMHARLAR